MHYDGIMEDITLLSHISLSPLLCDSRSLLPQLFGIPSPPNGFGVSVLCVQGNGNFFAEKGSEEGWSRVFNSANPNRWV